MSLTCIRTELASVVANAATNLTVYSYEHPEPNLPAAVVTWVDPIDFGSRPTADGKIVFSMVVRLMVGATDPLLTTNGLDGLVSSTIPDAIRNHETDVWASANPTFISPPEPDLNGSLSVELVVSVRAHLNS